MATRQTGFFWLCPIFSYPNIPISLSFPHGGVGPHIYSVGSHLICSSAHAIVFIFPHISITFNLEFPDPRTSSSDILISPYPIPHTEHHILIFFYPIPLVANTAALYGLRRHKAHLLIPWLFVYFIGMARSVSVSVSYMCVVAHFQRILRQLHYGDNPIRQRGEGERPGVQTSLHCNRLQCHLVARAKCLQGSEGAREIGTNQ